MFLKPIFLILASALSYHSMAQSQVEQITCFHPQACFLLEEIKTRVPSLKIQKIILKNFDPHHGEFSGKTFKSLLSAQKILFPPLSLNSSYQKMYKLRKKKDILLSDGHFWLSPRTYCKNKKELEKVLKINQSDCKINKLITNQKIKELKQFEYIVSHNSFEDWFKTMDLNFNIIDTHGHHSKMSSSTLKKIIKNLKDPSKKVIWIHEDQFPIPHFLESYTKKAHKLIKINTLTSSPQAIYSTLVKEIQ